MNVQAYKEELLKNLLKGIENRLDFSFEVVLPDEITILEIRHLIKGLRRFSCLVEYDGIPYRLKAKQIEVYNARNEDVVTLYFRTTEPDTFNGTINIKEHTLKVIDS